MSIECMKFKKFENGFLQGFADLYVIRWGLEIHGCSLYMKDGRRWLNLPSKEFQNEAGEKKWCPLVKLRDKDHQDGFVIQAIEAIDKYCSENQGEQAGSSGF